LVLLTRCYWGDDVMENEMGQACCVYGRTKMHVMFCLENLKERYNFQDLGIDGG
jgi:hypothetical protein